MRQILALLSMVAISSTAFATENRRVDAPISFDLPSQFHGNNVVLIGWSHIAWNGFVPSLITADLDAVRENLVIVTEDTPIKPAVSCISTTRGADYAAMLAKARFLEIPVVGGEPPLPALEANYLPMAIRNAAYAQTIERLVDQGKKVLLIVGYQHLAGISELLTNKQIIHRSIETKADYGRSMWGTLTLGRPGERFAPSDSDLKFYQGIEECPRQTCEEAGNSPAFCKSHGFN